MTSHHPTAPFCSRVLGNTSIFFEDFYIAEDSAIAAMVDITHLQCRSYLSFSGAVSGLTVLLIQFWNMRRLFRPEAFPKARGQPANGNTQCCHLWRETTALQKWLYLAGSGWFHVIGWGSRGGFNKRNDINVIWHVLFMKLKIAYVCDSVSFYLHVSILTYHIFSIASAILKRALHVFFPRLRSSWGNGNWSQGCKDVWFSCS